MEPAFVLVMLALIPYSQANIRKWSHPEHMLSPKYYSLDLKCSPSVQVEGLLSKEPKVLLGYVGTIYK